jgi:hypothetical protein
VEVPVALETPVETMRRWREHPAQFVREVFQAEPDDWQTDVLEAFPHNRRQAMTACKGPGKSTTLAWLTWYFLLTRTNCRIAVVSISSDTLKDTLWAEMGKWQAKSPLLLQYFTMTGERITCKEAPNDWWASARAYSRNANPQQQADTLAGLHAENAMAVIDEAGGIPASVLATAEAVLAGGKDQHVVLAGNPTNQNSALGHAVIDQRQLWHVTEITGDPDDPKRASRVDINWARQQIEAWGRDNPWVLVNVFGRFPPSGLNTLISPDQVRDAQKRHYNESQFFGFPYIIGVDVARFGDDEIVFFPRQGKIAYPPLRMRNQDTVFVASHLSRVANEKKADSIQVDISGSAGVYDVLRNLGHSEAIGVQFGGRAHQDRKFTNMRAEFYWTMCEDIKAGLALPPVPEMVMGLSTMSYTFDRQGRIQIEEKDQIKARIGRSPDLEDALGCTYAYPVAIQRKSISGLPEGLTGLINESLHRRGTDYDPFQRFADEQERQRG